MRASAAFVGDDMARREANARRDGRRSELDIALEVAGRLIYSVVISPPEHLRPSAAARSGGSAFQNIPAEIGAVQRGEDAGAASTR